MLSMFRLPKISLRIPDVPMGFQDYSSTGMESPPVILLLLVFIPLFQFLYNVLAVLLNPLAE